MSDDHAEQKPLKGIIGVITAPNGEVVAFHADFERQGYGGHTLAEAQAIRVKMGLERAFARAFLTERLLPKASSYFLDRFWENAVEHGYRKVLEPIGWTKEEARL